ncbi:MAG TPA: hypothetical protein VMX97_14645 [Hyphomicrobiaceae bacterium]|nr:hypothetical protein [Hyphomicrobiaceae bacterium]
MSLKALAHKVLQRNSQRNSDATRQECCRNSESHKPYSANSDMAGTDRATEYEERAAIIEFDGGYRRKQAEAMAAKLMGIEGRAKT